MGGSEENGSGETRVGENEKEVTNSENFSVENGLLKCKSNTPEGIYNLRIWARSGGSNYEEKTLPADSAKNFTWTVTKGKGLKKIQSIIDGQTVNFLPAFADGKAPGKFFKYDAGSTGYTELDNSTMRNLAAAIRAAGAENVYTDATGTFYGTINRAWSNTFKPVTGSDVSDGLNPDFTLPTGVSTVYYPVSGNWNKDYNSEPLLGTVGYTSFYNAYSSLLSRDADFVWSSRAYAFGFAYYWYAGDSYWSDCGVNWDYDSAVVLTQDF